ncbi:MAG TPA: hypothetical protein VHL58_11325 [Thermoanaerobaculia bacterium]|nr:hypothetical protein [Thermoanaerobaculia bacterium]
MIIMTLAVPSLHAEDFYEQQLRLGAQAFRAKRITQAVDELRIANFGLLDRPVLLSEGLARLSLAQFAAGRLESVVQTLNRFVDVEEQFKVYPSVRLEEAVKGDFERLLLKTVAPERLAALPSLAALSPSRAQQYSQLSPRERRKAYEAEARKSPSNPSWSLAIARDAASQKTWADVVKYASRALDLDKDNTEALSLRAKARFERREYAKANVDFGSLPGDFWAAHPEAIADRFVALAEAGSPAAAALRDQLTPDAMARPDVAGALKKLGPVYSNVGSESGAGAGPPPTASAPSPVAPETTTAAPTEPVARGSFTGPAADTVSQSKQLISEGKAVAAQKMLYSAIKRNPNRRDLRLGFLEASSLASDWRSAAAQVPLLEPFRVGEEPYMFYAAVVLFETGKEDQAREYLNRALPKLASSPLVDRYSRRILGSVQQ